MTDNHKTLCLFDVDGTLTKPRQKIDPSMVAFLEECAKKVPLALVGGSDLAKIIEQIGDSLDDVLSRFSYVFSENGLVAYKNSTILGSQTMLDFIGEEKLQRFINFCLRYIADLELPAKRGTFIEFRQGMLNVSPIGRNCSQSEREAFGAYDEVHKVRAKFIEALKLNFPADQYGLQYTVGGQISIDVFPIGWDKTYCLQYLVNDGFTNIHFFGDKTQPGGNDYEVFSDSRTIGHSVQSPEDTRKQLEELLSSL